MTTQSTPSGMSTSTSWRLCVEAPRTSSAPDAERTDSLSRARSSRWRPVVVSLSRSPSTVPSKQTVPPPVPAPGPRSTTWSAIAMVSGLCSTTSTVLPLSRSCSSRWFIRSMSCGCRPIVGSSKTYVTSVSDEPRWRIILVRCASPPDRVPAGRSSERYPRPISSNESSRCCSPVSSGPTDGSSRSRTQSARSLICIAQTSAMFLPLDLRRPGLLAEPGPVALGAGRERHRALHEGADVRLQRVDVLGQVSTSGSCGISPS